MKPHQWANETSFQFNISFNEFYENLLTNNREKLLHVKNKSNEEIIKYI